MRVIVLGAGVVGVTSAYYLHQLGHDVLVIDRQKDVAQETSFANAGEISPGYSRPWGSPGLPFKALTWLCSRRSPLILRPGLDPELYRWIFQLLRNCTSRRYVSNKSAMMQLALYSHSCLRSVVKRESIHYDDRRLGTLQLLRSNRQLDAAVREAEALRSEGIRLMVLDAKGCRTVEPALALSAAFVAGGVHFPDDGTGDCRKFTKALKEKLETNGVEFQLQKKVTSLRADGKRILAAQTDEGPVKGDAFVVALGSHTPALVRPLGVRLPIYPIKGYSLTARIHDSSAAPRSTVMDEALKVATTRLGDRVRIGGLAELCGYDLSLDPERKRILLASVTSLFGDAADYERAEFWCGLRPSTPDGPPLIGKIGATNLFVNAGHGTLGWTMACGSGRLLAELISGHSPEINPLLFRPDRIGSSY